MVRTHYVDYLQLKIKVLLAYVASILFISFLSVTILAYVIGGYQGLADIGTGYLSFGQQMLSWLGQWLILILFFCLLAVISMLMSVVIENRYLLQLFPVIAFLLVPIFISSTLGNLVYGVGVLMEGFISWNYQRIMYGLLHTAAENGGPSLGFLFPYMIAFVFFVLCVVVLYRANVKRFRTDYL